MIRIQAVKRDVENRLHRGNAEEVDKYNSEVVDSVLQGLYKIIEEQQVFIENLKKM